MLNTNRPPATGVRLIMLVLPDDAVREYATSRRLCRARPKGAARFSHTTVYDEAKAKGCT